MDRADVAALHAPPAGEKSHLAKLSAAQVAEIRRQYGVKSSRQLAQEYGVNQSQICRIANGKRWAR